MESSLFIRLLFFETGKELIEWYIFTSVREFWFWWRMSWMVNLFIISFSFRVKCGLDTKSYETQAGCPTRYWKIRLACPCCYEKRRQKLGAATIKFINAQQSLETNAVFRLERFTEVPEFTYLGKHFPCVNANWYFGKCHRRQKKFNRGKSCNYPVIRHGYSW